MGLFGLGKPDVKKMEARQDLKGLIKALENKDFTIRSEAARILGKIKSGEAAAPLIQVLRQDSEKHVREVTAQALGYIKDARAEQPLIDALGDEHSEVRCQAVYALGRIEDDGVVEPLIQALADRSDNVRCAAAGTLGWLKDSRAVGPLVQALLSDSWVDVRAKAAWALEHIGEPAVEPLIALVNSEETIVKVGKLGTDYSPLVDSEAQLRIAEVLRNWGDKRAVKPLAQAVQDSSADVRSVAAQALGEMGDLTTLEPLIQAFRLKPIPIRYPRLDQPSPNDKVFEAREKIGEAIEKITQRNGESAVQLLIQALQDKDSGVRQGVVDVLGKLGAVNAIEPLQKLLTAEEDTGVRLAAEIALSRLTE